MQAQQQPSPGAVPIQQPSTVAWPFQQPAPAAVPIQPPSTVAWPFQQPAPGFVPIQQPPTPVAPAQQPSTPAAQPNVIAYRNPAGSASLGDRKFTGASAVDPALARRLDEALKSGSAADRLFLAADTSYRQLNRAEYLVSVTVRIAPGDVRAGGGERLRLDFVGAVQDAPYATTVAQLAESLELPLDANARDALATTPIVYENAYVLLPGRYRVRFLVRDQATDRIGAIDVPFFVPNLNRIKR